MNEVIFVTGGLSGIGLAITRVLLKNKFTVYASYVNKSEAEIQEITKEIDSRDLHPVFLDVTSIRDCSNVINSILKKHKNIYGLVNNAGIIDDATFAKMTCTQWERVLRVNLVSLFNTTQPIFKSMIDNRFGRIINITSVNALVGQFGQCNYTASKAGVIGYTKSLALEGAKNNVLVNAVAPGYSDTEMMSAVPVKVLEEIKNKVPLKRLIDPAEVASMVCYLLSEKASAITGQTISVNGGLTMI